MPDRPSSRLERGMVSTVIPVFNRSRLLVRSVESVLRQVYPHKEIIIVDDGSSDETGAVAEELAAMHFETIAVVHQKNRGPGAAREAGRCLVRGEFIQYLDSDDVLLPRKFELQVEGLREKPECGISYCRLRHHSLPHDVPWKRTGEKIDTIFPSFLAERGWSAPAPLYRREVVDRAGPWLPLRQEEDWEYDCRIGLQKRPLHHCDKFLAEVGKAESSLSSTWTKDADLLRDRAEAHARIFAHAVKAGIPPEAPETQHFARELFFLARTCGDAGLEEESKRLFLLSREAAGLRRGRGVDYRLYGLAARVLGWGFAGRAAGALDRMRGASR